MTMKFARALVVLAVLIALAGVIIHIGALFAGSWLIFFNAPPSVVVSFNAGTLLAPVSCLVIAGLMGMCGYYAASVVGLVPRPLFQQLGLAVMASACLIRALLLPALAVYHPELRNAFEVWAAIVWGFAGLGLAVGFVLARNQCNDAARFVPA